MTPQNYSRLAALISATLPCCNWSVPSVDGRLQSAEQFPSLYGQVGQLALLPRSLPGLVLPHLEPERLQTLARFDLAQPRHPDQTWREASKCSCR